MQVEQAVYTSLRTSVRQGYHLVSRSAGIGDQLEQSLGVWCPTHAALCSRDLHDASLNFCSLGDGWLVLSRAMYGGPEYSGRGGLQVVTCMLVLRHEQLAGYDNNPLALARVALCLGQLRLPAAFPRELPRVELPESSLLGSVPESAPVSLTPLIREDTLRALRSAQRLALLGVKDRLATLSYFLRQIPKADRLELSFTTGLKPSLLRPFRLHLLPEADTAVRQQLVSQGVRCLHSVN